MKYSECCDVCLCTGVALLNGVGHATKKKVPHKNWCIQVAFFGAGKQTPTSSNPKMAAQHALVVVYSAEILDSVFMTET